MTGLYPGDPLLYARPVPLATARPLGRRCVAGSLTVLLLAALVFVFVEGTVIRAIRLVQPAVLVKLEKDTPKPPPPKIPPPLIRPQTTAIEPPQIVIAPDPIVQTPPAPVAMTSSPVPPAPVVTSPPPAPYLDPEYLKLLSVAIQSHFYYPSHAHVGGTVLVQYTIDTAGNLLALAVAHSSGQSALDDAALDVVRKASPLPPIPERMHAKQLTVRLPVCFPVPDSAFVSFGRTSSFSPPVRAADSGC